MARSLLWEVLFRIGFLAAPKEAERRQHVRHPCSFPVTVRTGAGDHVRECNATARDLSVGGMLIEGADVPPGIIRVQLQFEIPPDVLPDEPLVRTVQTSAAIRFRNPGDKTISTSFSDPLRPMSTRRFSADHWMAILLGILLLTAIPLAYHFHQLTKYLVVWAVGFGLTLVLTPVVRALARHFGVVDLPDERRAHRAPTPRGGGLALVAGFYGAALVALLFPWPASAGSLDPSWLRAYLISSGLLVLVGMVDDVRGLRPLVKLAGQVAAAGLMYAMGLSMGRLPGFELPAWLDAVATIVWFVALTNAFNLIVGLDGLATGLALVAGIGLMGAFFIRRMPSDALVMLGLAGACFAFLRYNFHPASIFLGDTGSMFLGFTFASIALATGSKGTFLASLGVPLLAVGIPVFDAVLAIWRRSMRVLAPADGVAGKGLMQPDAEHLHHRLRKKGLGTHQIAVMLYVINATLVLVGLLSLAFRDQALGIFLVAFVAGAYVVMRHLAEVELWDTGQAIIRGLKRPARRVAAFFIYPLVDVVSMILSLALATAVLQSVAPVDRPWDHWIAAIPLWVAPPFIIFCMARLYSRVWSLARTNDYLSLSVALLASILVSTGLSALLRPGDWPRHIVLAFVFAGLAHVSLLGGRMAVRGLVDTLSLWSESQYYRRGGVVRRVLLYGAGGRCLLFLNERMQHNFDFSTRRMIVGLVDDDANLRFRRVGGYVVLGAGSDLPALIRQHRIDEIIITAHLRDETLATLVVLCGLNQVRLSEWFYEERTVVSDEASPFNRRAFGQRAT